MSFDAQAFEKIYTQPSRAVVKILPQSNNGCVDFEICHEDHPDCSLIGKDYASREEAIKVIGKVLQGCVDRGLKDIGHNPMYLRPDLVDNWLKRLKVSNSNRRM